MPFGADEALKAQRAADRTAATRAEPGPDTATATAPPAPTPAAVPAAQTSPPAATRARFGRSAEAAAPAPVAQRAPAAPSPAPVARPAAPPIERPAMQRTEAQSTSATPVVARGYAHRLQPARKTSVPGLTPRLELYIDELAFQKGWAAEEVIQRKQAALSNTTESEAQYRAMFEEIRQLRRDTIQSLEQGLRQHPNDVVFVLQRGSNRHFSTLPKEKAGSYHILHGSAFHSMPASATLFPSPAELFASTTPEPEPAAGEPAAAQEVQASSAEQAPETGRQATRPPRP